MHYELLFLLLFNFILTSSSVVTNRITQFPSFLREGRVNFISVKEQQFQAALPHRSIFTCLFFYYYYYHYYYYYYYYYHYYHYYYYYYYY